TVNMLCMPARYQPCSTLGSFTGGTVGIPIYRLLHLRMLLLLATCGDARYSGLTMSSTYYRQSIAVLSSLVAATASAQTSTPPPQLDNIVVTASRMPQLARDVVGDVSVIDKAELQKEGQNSVAEILAKQPGIQFYSSGGPQTPTGVFVRGTGPSQALVLVDGVRINSITTGAI